jgi:replicative DNA helicase
MQRLSELCPVSTSNYETLVTIANNTEDNTSNNYIKTGFTDFDKEVLGLPNGNLTILAGRPAMGKSTLALNIAYNMARQQKKNVYFFSAEMNRTELYTKILSRLTDIDSKRISQRTLTTYELEKIDEAKRDLQVPLFIDDRSCIDTDYIRQSIINFKKETKKSIDCIFADHLHILRDKDKDRYKTKNDQLGNITSDLKAIAKEFNIPVVCLSQLSRNTELQGGDNIPKLADLRESGNIEQNADLVIMLYRESYYIQQKIRNSKKEEIRTVLEQKAKTIENQARMIVEKNRNGALADITVYCNLRYSKFADYAGLRYIRGANGVEED